MEKFCSSNTLLKLAGGGGSSATECIHITNSETTQSAQRPEQKSELRCCVAAFYFCFQIFYEIYKEFLVYFIVRLIRQ